MGSCGDPRSIVTFEDNGVGMNRDTSEQGLLKIASNHASRTDAGGFGLAKVLLFLGQVNQIITDEAKVAEQINTSKKFRIVRLGNNL